MLVKCNQGDLDFSVPEKYKSVGMKISGGADSAILCYLMSKYKKLERPDLKITLITGVIRTRPFQYEFASKIRDKIAEILEVSVSELYNDHVTFLMETPTLRLKQMEETNRLFGSGIIDCGAWGVTLNPPPEVTACYLPGRDTTRDKLPNGEKYPTWQNESYTPFSNIDKQGVKSIYDNEGVLEKIFPLTRSCELDNTYVFTGATTCKRPGCFWCQERLWGFGTND